MVSPWLASSDPSACASTSRGVSSYVVGVAPLGSCTAAGVDLSSILSAPTFEAIRSPCTGWIASRRRTRSSPTGSISSASPSRMSPSPRGKARTIALGKEPAGVVPKVVSLPMKVARSRVMMSLWAMVLLCRAMAAT